MSSASGEPWQFDMIGAATITAPNGEQITIHAQLGMTLDEERTQRFLLFHHGKPAPIIRILNGPKGCLPAVAVAAFRRLLDPHALPSPDASTPAR